MHLYEKALAELLDTPSLMSCPDGQSFEALLAIIVDDLVERDFPRLCQILYRMDVDEELLKRTLKENGGVAPGKIIARLLLERQKQKLDLRWQSVRPPGDIKEEDRW